MTVGIAALAENRGAIVLMSDKQLTEEPSGLKINSVDVKGFLLDNGWLVLYAGSGTFAHLVVELANKDLEVAQGEGKGSPEGAVGVMLWLKAAYAKAYDAMTRFDLFGPKLLDREMFVRRTYNEATIRQVEGLLEQFIQDDTCDLIAAGFDVDGDAQIVMVNAETEEVSDSFATIGSGRDMAGAHLSWRGSGFTDRLPRVVYEVFEAKAHAQRNVYVGEQTDAFVLFRNGPMGSVYLSKDTKDLLSDVIAYHDNVPLVRSPRDEEKKPKEPPTDWEQILETDKLEAVLKWVDYYRTKPRARAKWSASPNANEPPSGRSPSDGLP